MNIHKYLKVVLLIIGINRIEIFAYPVVSNVPLFMSGGIIQIGDAVACYCLAKILSLKYNIPFVYSHFQYHDFFAFSDREKSDLNEPIWSTHKPWIFVNNKDDIFRNLNNKNVLFFAGIRTLIDYIAPEWIAELKRDLQLKTIPHVFDLPKDKITVGVHIRKGNGGGQIYDGEVASEQEFDYDRTKVKYIIFENFPFDWPNYERKNGHFFKDHEYKNQLPPDKYEYVATKFPPNQFFIDTIKKLSQDLKDKPIFIQICTDDKNPEVLVQKIKNAVNKSNITFYYDNDRHLPYRDRILRDLYMLARVDVLIRPQSYFSKISEMIGNHKLVIFPFHYQWDNNKLIMTQIAMRGSISKL